MARRAMSFKEQKLDLLLKAEYLSPGITPDMNHANESHGAVVETFHTKNNTVVDDYHWSTDPAQLATNFYTRECEAPSKSIGIMHFHAKGSTLDYHSGNVQCRFGLVNPTKGDDRILVELGQETLDDNAGISRFNKVIGHVVPGSKDNLNIVDSSEHPDNWFDQGDTDGQFYISNIIAMTPTMSMIEVTGGRLFPNMPDNLRPTGGADDYEWVSGDSYAKFEGKYRIKFDDEFYIEIGANNSTIGELQSFKNDDLVGPYAPIENVLPELYGVEQLNDGITSGGRDLLEISVRKDETNTNSGTYTVLETEFPQPQHGMYTERIRVKERVTTSLNNYNNAVKRVNHYPRLEIEYRIKHQYDRPADV